MSASKWKPYPEYKHTNELLEKFLLTGMNKTTSSEILRYDGKMLQRRRKENE